MSEDAPHTLRCARVGRKGRRAWTLRDAADPRLPSESRWPLAASRGRWRRRKLPAVLSGDNSRGIAESSLLTSGAVVRTPVCSRYRELPKSALHLDHSLFHHLIHGLESTNATVLAFRCRVLTGLHRPILSVVKGAECQGANLLAVEPAPTLAPAAGAGPLPAGPAPTGPARQRARRRPGAAHSLPGGHWEGW